MKPRYDVVGIGNALVDVLSHENDSFLERFELVRGSMTLIDPERATELYDAMGPAVEVSGGATANTIAGLASFGGTGAFVGKVYDDQLGQVFAHDLKSMGVAFSTVPAITGPPTGRCLIVVSADGERTMNTCLGASQFLDADDVDPDVIAAGSYTFLEGYLFDQTHNKEAYWKASKLSHDAGRQVALSLSDTFCVDRHRDEWIDLVREGVDVLFANEGEIQALYGEGLDQAFDQAREAVGLACITLGPNGSVLLAGDTMIEVPAVPVEHVIDTTGAGDQYAAGVLYGLTHGYPLAACGRLGSIAAGEVISHLGPRPETSYASLARDV